MKEWLLSHLEKLWLRKRSIPFAFALLTVGYICIATVFDGWTWITVPLWGYLLTAAIFFCAGVGYGIACISYDHLPRAPKGTLAVLFCIDAESDQLCETVRFKLVDNFNAYALTEGARIHAKCVAKKQIDKYDLQDKQSILLLLQKTNCVLFVYVRCSADNVNQAENYELRINCAVSHPNFNEKAKEIISQDLRMMKKSVGRQKFTSANAINIFNSTTQTLVYACQYILGFVYLLSGDNRNALELLMLAKKNIAAKQTDTADSKILETLVNDRIYSALCQMCQDLMATFQNDKSLEQLEKLSQILNMANTIRPETYFYNINLAYVHIALNHNARAAKNCIEKCKIAKGNESWRYSDAFLSAYCGHAPTTILGKYAKALRVPYNSLVEIVDFIEFIIESEPQKVSLHLAAGLVYEAMGEAKLMRRHLSTFLACGSGINQKTKDLLTKKVLAGDCGEECDQACAKCVG